MLRTKTKMCSHCHSLRACDKVYRPWNVFHLLMVLMTVGIWIPVMVAVNVSAYVRGWRCRTCGHRV